MDKTQPRKESWNSRVGVILAVSGSAVGLGNFLRFPGQVAEYGGGAFMVAYFISFLLIGLPICWAEWTLGRFGGKTGFNASPGILGSITRIPKLKFIGVIGIVIPITIYMYYVVIEAWCLAYATNYLFGDMDFQSPGEASYFFVSLIGATADGSALKFDMQHIGFYVLIVFVLNFILIYRGVAKGIELFCRYAMPTLVVIAVIIMIRVLTLGTPDAEFPDRNINNGLGFMWNPSKMIIQEQDPETGIWRDQVEVFPGEDLEARLQAISSNPELRMRERSMWTQLLNPELWLAAASQIFFSLSVGFGIIVTYSSYMKKDDDIVLSGLSAAAANEFCEVCLGGVISIPAAVAFFGVAGLAGIGLGTFDIGFNVLPLVFAEMPLGMVFGFLFFFLLFLAAVTSSLSMLQPGIAFLEESMNLNRRQSVTILGTITSIGAGFVLYFSQDLKALDTLDYWVTNLLMVLLALAQIIIFAWVIGLEKGFEEAHRGSAIRIPKFFGFIMKYVCPTLLISIFIAWFLKQLGVGVPEGQQKFNGYIQDLFINPNAVAWMSVGIILIIGLFCILSLPDSNRLKNAQAEPESGGNS